MDANVSRRFNWGPLGAAIGIVNLSYSIAKDSGVVKFYRDGDEIDAVRLSASHIQHLKNGHRVAVIFTCGKQIPIELP